MNSPCNSPTPDLAKIAGARLVTTGRGRVLVVDDEQNQRDILQVILESEGYEPVTAANGQRALDIARTQLFDAVLTDLKMPDMDGIALLSELQRAQPSASVVLMTAHGTITSAVDAMRKGALDYLQKPIEKDVLIVDTVGFAPGVLSPPIMNSDKLHVVERWKFIDRDTIAYSATLEDPKVYTRPWTIDVVLHRRRDPGFQLIEDYCYTLEYEQYYPHQAGR